MKKLKDVKILTTSKFTCACCGTDFLLFSDRIKRYAYKKNTGTEVEYYCRYNCWVKE